MLKDVDLNNHLFDITFGFSGKHPESDRDAVIKELKAQGKWKEENQLGNISIVLEMKIAFLNVYHLSLVQNSERTEK